MLFQRITPQVPYILTGSEVVEIFFKLVEYNGNMSMVAEATGYDSRWVWSIMRIASFLDEQGVRLVQETPDISLAQWLESLQTIIMNVTDPQIITTEEKQYMGGITPGQFALMASVSWRYHPDNDYDEARTFEAYKNAIASS